MDAMGEARPAPELDEAAAKAILDESKSVDQELQLVIPLVAQARRAYFNEPTDATKAALQAVEKHAGELHTKHVAITDRMQKLAGVSDDELESLLQGQRGQDKVDRAPRAQLTKDKIHPTARVESVLSASFEKLLALVGSKMLKSYSELPRKQGTIAGLPLSLVGGVRPESERPEVHRFAQSILVTQDFLNSSPGYDHFWGALLVPQMAALSAQLDRIQEIPRGANRLKSLWRRASGEVDSTIFELLVGAGCVAKGRKVEFLEATSGKTPDMFCHDPYPLAIECKRKKPLSSYELREEQLMRTLYLRLETAARAAGVWGRFHLILRVECTEALLDDVVAKLMQQRFAGVKPVDYDWGSVAFIETASRIDMPRPTPLYSPNMLGKAFGWNTDLQRFDGLLCRISNDDEPVVDRADHPVGLLWTNISEQALKKRSWGPMSVVSEALEQIPAGDFGIVYVAYQDGTREETANSRLAGFSDWLHEMAHRSDIRVPVCKLVRLFPRALGDGRPDLIESTVEYKAQYADDVLPSIYPSRVFTAV